MGTGNNNYTRISQLGEKIKNNTATPLERDEYMTLMYNTGLIGKEQYDQYLANKNTDDLVKAALVVGAIALIAYLVSKS